MHDGGRRFRYAALGQALELLDELPRGNRPRYAGQSDQPAYGIRNESVPDHKGPLRDILAKNMRRLRAMRGLTQEALAHDCGINRTISALLSGLSGTSQLTTSRV
jgi:hypothetical protein